MKGFFSSLFSRLKIIYSNQVKQIALVSWHSAAKEFFFPASSSGRELFAPSWWERTERLVPSPAPWKELPPTSWDRRVCLFYNLVINSPEMYYSYYFPFLVQTQGVGCCSEQGKAVVQYSSHFWPLYTRTHMHTPWCSAQFNHNEFRHL